MVTTLLWWLQAAPQAQVADVGAIFLEVIKLGVVPVVVAIVSFILGKRQTKANIHKTESETISNYITTINDLQQKMKEWIDVFEEKRAEAQDLENKNEKYEDNIEQLYRLFRKEKDHVYDFVSKALRLIQQVEREAHNYPEYKQLQRETIQITEILVYVKNKLDPTVNTITLPKIE